jgi:alpha-1,6-mannosyltransferase
MKFCDITIAYNDKSGGIRTYIDEKRRFLLEHTDHEHLLIVPGEKDCTTTDGRSTIVHVRGPLLPNQSDYRVFLSPRKIKSILRRCQPDVIELGSYYVEPWAAFSYRRRRREAGRDCLIGGYFHTDVAEAYVASPLRLAAHGWLDDVSEALGNVVEKIADVAGRGAEQYMRYVFQHCDVVVASTPSQAERLHAYGVDAVDIVPMGVDLALFSPARRRQSLRRQMGAAAGSPVLAYAGRLSTEKRLPTLMQAFDCLPPELGAQLWVVGDGPLRPDIEAAAQRNPDVKLLPYESDRVRFAEILASADIYVTAGPHETFGLSVIEAQASGLPVVGVAAGALTERVPEGLGYLGPVDDAQAMADNIVRAASQRRDMGVRARRHVQRRFGWENTFRKLLDCYDVQHSARRERKWAEDRQGQAIASPPV